MSIGIDEKTLSRFNALRKMVDEAIEHAWAQGEPGKSYEGAWEVTCEFPSTDEGGAEKDATYWMIVLHCYLIGPNRHYSWKGKTLEQALDECSRDVEMWCRAEMNNNVE